MLTGGGASCCACSCFEQSFSLHGVRCHTSDWYPVDRTIQDLAIAVCGGSCVLVAFQLPDHCSVSHASVRWGSVVLLTSRVLLVEVAC